MGWAGDEPARRKHTRFTVGPRSLRVYQPKWRLLRA